MHTIDWGALDGAVKQLRVLKKDLDALDDHVGHDVAAIEQLLTELKLGIPIFVDLPSFDAADDGEAEGRALLFTKHQGTWKIVYTYGSLRAPEKWQEDPFHSCTRDIRVELAKHLPTLVLNAVEWMTARIKEREALIANTTKLREVLAKSTEET